MSARASLHGARSSRTRGVASIAGCAAAVALVALVATTPSVARAQIEAGQVVDDSANVILDRILVTLQRDVAGTWQVVDTMRTDARGMFQFLTPAPGTYRVGLAGITAPFYFGAADTLGADSVQERRYRVPLLHDLAAKTFFDFQVEQPAAVPPGSRQAPAYPSSMKHAGTNGLVEARFIVMPDGRTDPASFTVLSATRPEFVAAVREYLPRAKYLPARINGVPVAQVVQQTFFFRLDPPAPPPPDVNPPPIRTPRSWP